MEDILTKTFVHVSAKSDYRKWTLNETVAKYEGCPIIS